MSEVNYASGTGTCGKCGQQLLQIEDDGSKLCVLCKSKRLIEGGPQVTQARPSEEEINRVLAKAGISVAKPGAPAVSSAKAAPLGAPAPMQVMAGTFEETVTVALKAMKSLPMPKDVKQFKVISRIIAQMESLLEAK